MTLQAALRLPGILADRLQADGFETTYRQLYHSLRFGLAFKHFSFFQIVMQPIRSYFRFRMVLLTDRYRIIGERPSLITYLSVNRLSHITRRCASSCATSFPSASDAAMFLSSLRSLYINGPAFLRKLYLSERMSLANISCFVFSADRFAFKSASCALIFAFRVFPSTASWSSEALINLLSRSACASSAAALY
jgi:hypothetical protein